MLNQPEILQPPEALRGDEVTAGQADPLSVAMSRIRTLEAECTALRESLRLGGRSRRRRA